MRKPRQWIPTRLCACGDCRFTDRQECPTVKAQASWPDELKTKPVQLWVRDYRDDADPR